MKLTLAKIRAAKPAPQNTANRRHARYGDGRGLWLIVDPNGKKSWAFLYTINKRRRQMGLGSIEFMGLDSARDEALRLRRLVKRGIDPLAQKEAERIANSGTRTNEQRPMPSFEILAAEVIELRTANMKNRKAKVQWTSTLSAYVYPHIGAMPLTMSVINAVAEFERDLLIERTQAGLRRAKAEGKKLGRPRALDERQQKEAIAMRKAGHSLASIALKMGVNRSAIQRLEQRAAQ